MLAYSSSHCNPLPSVAGGARNRPLNAMVLLREYALKIDLHDLCHMQKDVEGLYRDHMRIFSRSLRLLSGIHLGHGQRLGVVRSSPGPGVTFERFLESVHPEDQDRVAHALQSEEATKAHRARVMEELGAESLAELVRFAERLGIRSLKI